MMDELLAAFPECCIRIDPHEGTERGASLTLSDAPSVVASASTRTRVLKEPGVSAGPYTCGGCIRIDPHEGTERVVVKPVAPRLPAVASASTRTRVLKVAGALPYELLEGSCIRIDPHEGTER